MDSIVKFPSGETGLELLHYMGATDRQTLTQRPLIAQRLVDKCEKAGRGKEVNLTRDELEQLISEVDNMIDIKGGNLGYGWNALQHHSLLKYRDKLNWLFKTS